jgi:RNA polymerase-binding transcription factor DksA
MAAKARNKALIKKSAPSAQKVSKKSKPAKASKARKPIPSKSAPKKVVAKKPVPKKSPKTKSAAKPAPKASAKKPTPAPKKKPAASKPSAPATSRNISLPPFPIKGSNRPTITIVERAPGTKPKPLPKPFLEAQKKKLLELRDHILDQMQGVAQDSLRSKPEGSAASAFGMHQADAGSDAYEKDFALSLLSQEQDALYEIEEALKRIEDGTYGTCEMTQQPIPRARMEAIPFARFTVECQSKLERENRGRRRWETTPQFMDSADNFFEEEDDGDDEDRPKIKE